MDWREAACLKKSLVQINNASDITIRVAWDRKGISDMAPDHMTQQWENCQPSPLNPRYKIISGARA